MEPRTMALYLSVMHIRERQSLTLFIRRAAGYSQLDYRLPFREINSLIFGRVYAVCVLVSVS
jgi:hypothetical protein